MEIKVNNKTILVDEIPSWFGDYSWYVSKLGYVKGEKKNSKNRENVSLHRLLLGLKKGDGKIVDHINRNPSDNRLSNLRLVNFSESNFNRISQHDKDGRLKNIYKLKIDGRYYYQAQVQKDRKTYTACSPKLEVAIEKARQLRERLFGRILLSP